MPSLFRKAKDKLDQRQSDKREQSDQRMAYSSAVMALAQPGADVEAILVALPDSSAFKSTDRDVLHKNAFRAIADAMLADDILDEREESGLFKAGDALGITADSLYSDFGDLLSRIMVARINDGRLPEVAMGDVRLPVKPGEVVHLSTPAQLNKWVAVREYQGAYSGVSFRLAKGVRYHTGGSRGRSVVVGQELKPEDAGQLTITSRRAVFSGAKKSLQFEYPKLLDLEVFTDGIKLAVSNRQAPSLFTLPNTSGDVIAALINAAVGRQ